jgi:hypothetical protein
MTIDIEEYVDYLSRVKLSPDQHLILTIICTGRYSAMYRYMNQVRGFHQSDIDDLVKRGLIFDANKESKKHDGQEYYPDMYIATSTGYDLVIQEEPSFDQIWEMYPPFTTINGKMVPLKATDKAKLEKEYMNIIKGKRSVHREVMDALTAAKSRGLLNMSIVKWITSMQWEEIKKLNLAKEEGYGSKLL